MRSSVRRKSTSLFSQWGFIAALGIMCVTCFSNVARSFEILGTGTESLLGGDLTDPEDDGDPEFDDGYDAIFDANSEPGFGSGEEPEGAGSGEAAFNVFDNILGPGNDKWCCGKPGGIPEDEGLWVTAEFDRPYRLTHFTLSSANDVPGRDPTVFAVQGSNDGVNFTDIFNYDDIAPWDERLQVIQFSAPDDFPVQTTGYSTFRFVTFDTEFNESNNAYFQVGEIEYFGEPGGGGAPTTVVIEEGIDTTLATGLNGPDAPHGAEGTNPDGVERWEWDGSDGGGENHGLLWFDIPQDVLSAFGDGTAKLALHIDNNGNAGTMYRMTSDWLSGPDGGDEVTFNNIPDGPGVVPGQNAEADSNAEFPDSIGQAGQVLTVDVSADVKAWAVGADNFGWGFVPVGGDGAGMTSFENASNPVPTLTLTFTSRLKPALQAGDADQDLDFDQLDLVAVSIGGLYLTGNRANWREGDWNGAPGGSQGNPPAGDGQFNQLDIIAALGPNHYLTGPYAALQHDGTSGDDQTSLVYDATTGKLSVDAPAGSELTSINITSTGSMFIGDKPAALDGAFDNFAADNVFKATFGGSFGSITFGNVLPVGMSEEGVAADLSAVGSLAGGGDLGAVDLIFVPEPFAMVMFLLGGAGALTMRRRR